MNMTAKKQPNIRQHLASQNFQSLKEIVTYWKANFQGEGEFTERRDPVVRWCMKAKTLEEAVQRAVESRGENGKMFNHQSKVRETSRHELGELFLAEIFTLRGVLTKKHTRKLFRDFDELHDFIALMAPWGIGPVTVYDVALRIGAYLKIEPDSLYLHAGVRIGLEALLGKKMRGVLRVPMNELPAPLRELPPNDVEDMMCAHRAFLRPELLDG